MTMESNEIAEKWISQVKGLVSPPDICISIFELIESQTASTKQLGDVISQDPNLTARLLKIVNSPYYHFSNRIDTISRAITVIGIRELSSLVLAVSAAKTFSNIPNELVNIDTFWRHSIYTALIARELAKRCDILHPERLFVAGLMHDIGSLIIYNRVPDIARAILIQSNGNEQTLYQTEKDMLNTNHAQIGGMLLDSWLLPKILRDAVMFHHEPGLCETAPIEASIVHIAEALANASIIGGFSSEACGQDEIAPEAWTAIHMNAAELDTDELVGAAGLQFTDMNNSLNG
jgi:putative nucleotidyltransferase with HDIG domain